MKRQSAMAPSNPREKEKSELKCPECRASLKKRRGRRVDDCEMVCGGCGQIFDVCDADTLESLKRQS
jgi:hypothetical protein